MGRAQRKGHRTAFGLARESDDRSERVTLAQEALEISEECAEAYVILGDQDAESPEHALEMYSKGVEYGARFLGAEGFADSIEFAFD